MGEIITQRLVIPHQLPTANDGLSAAIIDGVARGAAQARRSWIGDRRRTGIRATGGYASMKDEWGMIVNSLARAANLKMLEHVQMEFYWRYCSRHDPDNLYTIATKIIIDAIIGIVIPNDTARYIRPPHVHSWETSKTPSVTVTMTGPVRE
jgi:hypothetical protein